MRSGWWLAVWLACGPMAQAEEVQQDAGAASQAVASPDPVQAELTQLRQRLESREREHAERIQQLEAAAGERETTQVARLRQENQRLRLQLREAQAAIPPPVLSEPQQWFAVGGSLTLIALLLGMLAGGWRKQRRHWLN
ncbi:hypothetical protein [uncultured Pseudomonas sp.]|uniref:hypothetical protein n=1 Tax=uncultured Pseudomonas sp. TaxID=114707 RepID=UPI0025D39E60|nr:hypothetical protein [uncultured Pseudomonas sp.]